MKKTLTGFLVICACSVFGEAYQQGLFEIGLDGKHDFENADGKTETEIRTSLGYYVAGDVQLGGLINFANSGSDIGWGAGPYIEVNLDFELVVVPYAAFRATANFGELYPADHLMAEAAAGLKIMLSDYVALAAEVYYDMASKEIFINNGRERSTDVGMHFGVRACF